jgi:hypothetical protein
MQRQRINLPIAFILIWLGLSLVIFQPGKAIAHALNMQYETTSAIKLHVDDGGVVLTDAQVNVFAPDNLGEPWLRAIVTTSIATTSGGTATYSPMQKTVMITSVLWGCVGTAYFSGGGNKHQCILVMAIYLPRFALAAMP